MPLILMLGSSDVSFQRFIVGISDICFIFVIGTQSMSTSYGILTKKNIWSIQSQVFLFNYYKKSQLALLLYIYTEWSTV